MSDVIKHHGILGQKWGVRRYQEEDGSLTAAGKKRYGQNGAKTQEALTEDSLMLRYKAAGGKIPTSKSMRMTAGHEDRYKTANELFAALEDEVKRRGGVGRVGDGTAAEYQKKSYRIKDLREAGLADTKGISLVAQRHSTNPEDVTIRYRYYTDEAIEPTYYDNIKDLEKAVEEMERKKKEKEKEEKKKSEEMKKATKSKDKNINDKVNDAVNAVVQTIKNLPSSVLSTSKAAIDKGKSLVSGILEMLKR